MPSFLFSAPLLRLALATALVSIPLACGGGGGGGSTPPPTPPASPIAADFEAWANALPAKHPDLYFKLPKAQFDGLVQQLKVDGPGLTQAAYLARWRRILGAVGDEHTWFDYPELSTASLPLQTRHFPDGLGVLNASAEHADLVGARLETVGGVRAANLQEALRPYLAYSVEPAFLRMSGEYVPMALSLFQTLGILPAATAYPCTFASADGSTRTVTLSVVKGFAPSWTSPLLRDQEPASNYYFRELSQEGVVYLRYRLCGEMATRPLEPFGSDLLAALAKPGVRKLVLDLRGNPGGNSALLDPLLAWIATSTFNHPDRFLVLVDAGVFSSAFLNAGTCRFTLSARLLGETIGQALWQYGDVKSFVLPSGRVAYHSSKLFKVGNGTPSDPFHAPFDPDVKILETLKDFRDGLDPVLTEALK